MKVCFDLQAEQETDEVYAQITLHPEADVRNMFFFFVLFIVLFQLALFGSQQGGRKNIKSKNLNQIL